MKRAIHFDVAQVLAAYDAMIVSMAKKAEGNPAKEIQVRAAHTVGRAYMQFLTDEKNMGTDHALVAMATGFTFASLLENLSRNYSCPCTFGKALQAFERAVEQIEQGKSTHQGEDVVHGVVGGNA